MAKKEGNVKLKFRVDNSKGFDNVKIVRKRFKATKVPDGITSKKAR